MDYCLKLVDVIQVSKAKRIFCIFKPKETIIWEPFDLQLKFKNIGDQDFPGGKCNFTLKGELVHHKHEANLPKIKSKEAKWVVAENLEITEPGYVGLTWIYIENISSKPVPLEYGGKTVNRFEGAISLRYANREELYQKYSVVVALFFSILATILTIVNVLVSIFT